MNTPKSSLFVAGSGPWLSAASQVYSAIDTQPVECAFGHSGAQGKSVRWKRVLDITCLLLGLPGLVVLMMTIAMLIKLVSPGPVFFRQERVGYRRRRFLCLKFRTMKVGAETNSHQQHLQQLLQSNRPMTKMDRVGDPRLIPFGRILRATGLDELPQLINVLRGEMSLVGPRPCTPYELEGYQAGQYERFDAAPGLTGLWQVSGKNHTTFTEMIDLDVRYARTKSLWLDLKIMAATFGTLASQVQELKGQGRLYPRSR